MEAGIDSQASREISTFCRSFWSASFSNSADSPPQKMSTSGLPFHSTMRPYANGVPAGNRVHLHRDVPLLLRVLAERLQPRVVDDLRHRRDEIQLPLDRPLGAA